MRIFVAVMALVAMAAFVACGDDDNSASSTPTRAGTATTTAATGTSTPSASGETIDVSLQEFSINPSVLTIGAGAVKFTVKNTGPQYKHEFVVLKTDLDPAALPKQADGTVDEEGAGVTSPGEIGDLAIGAQESATIDLTPGKYIFICNLVDQDASGNVLHFTNGMFRAFTVQ